MPPKDHQSTPTSSLAVLPSPKSTPRPTPKPPGGTAAEAKQDAGDIGQIVQMMRAMNARLDRLERAPAKADPSNEAGSGLERAVAEVASFRFGRPGGAPPFAVPAGATPGRSVKDQLRRGRSTPFPPGPQSRWFSDAYAGHDSDADDADRTNGDTDVTGDGRIAEVLMANLRANYRSALDYVLSLIHI